MADRKAAPRAKGEQEEEKLSEVGLTQMEEEILEGLAHGKPRRRICQELGISRSLYHYYLHGVRRHLRVRTTIEAVLAYQQQKLEAQSDSEAEGQSPRRGGGGQYPRACSWRRL